jgi:hypothetical protein
LSTKPGISHLLFADDSLLFFEENVDQENKVKAVLNNYEQATGQLLNPENALYCWEINVQL